MAKIGIIIPHRNDRPRLLSNCLRMMGSQTVLPEIIELVDYDPLSNGCDITQRYRKGYDNLRNKGLDIIALIEDDDWYAQNYIESMVNEWEVHDKPDIFGLNHTLYYHLKLFSWFKMNHTSRSSAMNTLIKPDLNFKWCHDNEPFTDIHLWKTLKGVIIQPKQTICMGMKHGTGLCGGKSHVDRLHRFINKDNDKSFLRNTVDSDSFKFYSTYFEESINNNTLLQSG